MYLILSPEKSTPSILANLMKGRTSATSLLTKTFSPDGSISYFGSPVSIPKNPLNDLATPSTDRLSGRFGKNSTLISSYHHNLQYHLPS